MPNMTIKDIARLSGCSVSTISRVINDRPDVRPETKEKVLQMMRESGFVPNTNARQLKIQQSRSLVFVVKGTRNIFFSDFLVQLQRAATLYGYNGIVSYLDENANEIDAAEKILREIKPKGIIFLGGRLTMATSVLPTSCSGSYHLWMPERIWRSVPVPSSSVKRRSFSLFFTASQALTFTARKSDLEKVSKSTRSVNSGSICTLEKSIFSSTAGAVGAVSAGFAGFLSVSSGFMVGTEKTSRLLGY